MNGREDADGEIDLETRCVGGGQGVAMIVQPAVGVVFGAVSLLMTVIIVVPTLAGAVGGLLADAQAKTSG